MLQAGNDLSAKEAGQAAINFINKAVEQDGVTASLLSTIEESGVYKVHLNIGDKEYDSFMSKDGKYLFSSAFDLQEPQASQEQEVSPSLEALANCLTEKGAKFYGAFWCSHCNNQKEMFGEAAKSLPYIECSTEDGNGQLDICKDNNVTGYPTWEFTDGTRETGELSPEKLAEKTGCQISK